MKYFKKGTGAAQRCGFTVVETVLALAILGGVMVLVTQTAVWSMQERARNGARKAALEVAGNILESARALSWKDLTQDWAAQQRLPKQWQDSFPEGQVNVRVEPEKSLAQTKRVTVTIRWRFDNTIPAYSVELVSLLSARSAATTGGKS